MGFNAVFGCLKEVFPQVDFRILKAVAIEHSNDVDAAVMDVLNEVLPSLTRLPLSPVSPAKGQSPRVLPTPVGHKEKSEKRKEKLIKESGVGTFSEPGSTSGEDANNTYHTGGTSQDDPTLLDEAHSLQDFHVISNALIHQATEHQELECMNFNVKVGLQQSPSGMETSSIHETDGVSGSLNDLLSERKDFGSLVTDDPDLVMHATCDKVESCLFDFLEKKSSIQLDSPLPEHSPVLSEFCSSPLLADEKLQATGFSDLTSKNDCSPRSMGDIDESTMNSLCNIDVLKEIIEDAKNNKKTLFSAMESVITMMREVELQEKAVDHVKEEAARGGLDIMVKVEELKQMLAHAKDANDMHAGEVYGEKAILSTEVKELQSRLLSLSDERDKSLAILNEMRATLESRLDTVVEARKMAELEKLEKEESARTALAEQEAIMEKVVQESKILQQEAEENSKLREFLMDRGRIVDMLQGEISVICQDVRLLKEKFDERVPLSLSVSSSQTSCILASSGSSIKSMASDLVLERVESFKTLEKSTPIPSVNDLSPKSNMMASDFVLDRVESSKTLEKASPVPSVDGLSPKGRLEDERAAADKKALLDDGWDIFDEDTELDV